MIERDGAREPADEADWGRHPSFARYQGLAGGPGSLSLSLGLMNRALFAVIALLICYPASSADDWRITTRGYGPVRAGISAAEASRLLSTRLHTHDRRVPEPSCDYLYPENGHKGLSLMVQHGRVTHIVISTPGAQTQSGAKVGDSTARLKELFGSRLEVESHKYDDDGFYYYVWEQGKRHGIKFEIGGDHVTEIYAGDETIQYVEGCS